jgi:hypothetical protein
MVSPGRVFRRENQAFSNLHAGMALGHERDDGF